MLQISANSGSHVSVCGEISIFSKEYGPQFNFIRLGFVQMGFRFENSKKSGKKEEKNLLGKKITQVSKWLKLATFVGFSPESLALLAGDCL